MDSFNPALFEHFFCASLVSLPGPVLAPLIMEAGDKVLLLTLSDSCTHTYDPYLEWPWLAEPPPPTPDHGSSSPNEVFLEIHHPDKGGKFPSPK